MALPAMPIPLRDKPEPRSGIHALTQPFDILEIPYSGAEPLFLRYALLEQRDEFGKAWQYAPLQLDPNAEGFFRIDLSALGIPDGTYEYAPIVKSDEEHPFNDPYAQNLTQFGGYRGVFRMDDGHRVPVAPFSWDDELRCFAVSLRSFSTT